MPDLNQQVCEKLGIEPTSTWVVGDADSHCFSGTKERCEQWHADHVGYVQRFSYTVRERARYPDLASNSGFFILWAALKRNGWSICAVDDGQDCWAKLSRSGGVEVRSGYYDTPQQALLMAAATALGVQE